MESGNFFFAVYTQCNEEALPFWIKLFYVESYKCNLQFSLLEGIRIGSGERWLGVQSPETDDKN